MTLGRVKLTIKTNQEKETEQKFQPYCTPLTSKCLLAAHLFFPSFPVPLFLHCFLSLSASWTSRRGGAALNFQLQPLWSETWDYVDSHPYG